MAKRSEREQRKPLQTKSQVGTSSSNSTNLFTISDSSSDLVVRRQTRSTPNTNRVDDDLVHSERLGFLVANDTGGVVSYDLGSVSETKPVRIVEDHGHTVVASDSNKSNNSQEGLFPPRLVGKNQQIAIGAKIRGTNLYDFYDLDGDPLGELQVLDSNTSRASGYFTLRGAVLDAGRWHIIKAADLPFLQFVSGLTLVEDKIVLRARDDDGFGNGDYSQPIEVSVKTVTPNRVAPVVSMADFRILSNESIQLANYISARDPDDYPLTQYRIMITGAGDLKFNGNTVAKGKWFTLGSGQLDKLEYFAPSIGAGTSSARFQIQVMDGKFWSAIDPANVSVTANRFTPTITADTISVARNDDLLAHALFSAADRDGNTYKKIAFYDTGVRNDGGYFTVNGVRQAALSWFEVDYDKLHTIKYIAPSIFDSEAYRVRVYDGRYWSDVATGRVTTINKPVIDTVDYYVANELTPVQASVLFSQADAGPNLIAYEIIDMTTNPLSGTWQYNGVDLAAGEVHRIAAANIGNLRFVGGDGNNRSVDELYVRADNGTYVGDWTRLYVNTEPWATGSLNRGGSWAPVAGTPVSLTFSFLQQVPNYYAIDADERNGFAVFNGVARDGIRRALAKWSEIAGITFTEVNDIVGGQFRFGTFAMDTDTTLAYAYLPLANPLPIAGDIWFNNASIFAGTPEHYDVDMGEGSTWFLTALHEIGHALGLSHPFMDDPLKAPPFLPAATDTRQFTVMSYSAAYNGRATNPVNPISLIVEPNTPMLYDALTMQAKYGLNATFNDTNTTYTFTNDSEFVEAIWDTAGNDTINLSNFTSQLDVNLNPGVYNSVGPLSDNLVILYGADIENLIGGKSHDRLTGNKFDNIIRGNEGGDTISGEGGDDYLDGGIGDDTYLFGTGDGHDTIVDAGGVDTVRIDLSLASIDATGFLGETNALPDYIAARVVGSQLHLSLSPKGDQAHGSIVIRDMQTASSRIEILQIYDGNRKIGRNIDLASIFVQAGDEYSRFKVSEFASDFGQIAVPV